MASMQLMKQRNAREVTRNTTAVDQKQSLELVQTMFHGALSILTYMRALLPQKAYEMRSYESRDSVLPYEDFAAARMPSLDDATSGASTALAVLQRGRSKRADAFLDLLENGVFTELNSGKLRAVQLLILADSKRRDEILEVYTFTIDYTRPDRATRVPSGIRMESSEHVTATVATATTALQNLLREVAQLCEELPNLPKKRYLGIELVYDDATANHRHPTGFVPGRSNDLLFAQAQDWNKRTAPFTLKSGHHDTTVKVSHLQRQAAEDDSLSDPPDFPKAVAFIEKLPRFEIVDSTLKSAHSKADTSSTDPQPSSISTSPVPHEGMAFANQERSGKPASAGNCPQGRGDNLAMQQSDVPGGVRTSSQTWNVPTSDLGGTQSSLVPEMRNALNHMMQPESIAKGDTQTQGIFRQPSLRSEATATPTTTNASPSNMADHVTPLPSTIRLALSPEVRKDFELKTPFLRKTSALIAQKIGTNSSLGHTILCVCGHTKDEGDMAQCHVCETWQHLHCQGYTGSQDPRLPEKHACYACMLGTSKVPTFEELQELSVRRRVMLWILHNGLRTKSDLSKDLSLDPKIASSLHTSFKKSDCVVGTSMSHKPGYRATGQPLFVPVKEGPAYESMFRRYFDPTTLVEEHYEGMTEGVMSQAAAALQRLIGSRADSMPPPATPYPGRKKKVAGTPNSTLDLPIPSAAYETPTLPGRRQTRGSKRSIESEDAASSPAKRVATPITGIRQFSSLMSTQLIDANGKSSPVEQSWSARRSKR